MNRQINENELNSTSLFSDGGTLEVSFSDVLSSQRPQSAEEVAQRWVFLKNEYKREKERLNTSIDDDVVDAALSYLLIIFCALVVISLAWILA